MHNYDSILNEIPKYRKKKRNGSSVRNRSNHKHIYEKIITENLFTGFCWGEICSTCGRVVADPYSDSNLADFRKKDKERNTYIALSKEEVHAKFPQYRIFMYKRVKENGFDFKGNKYIRERCDLNSPMVEISFADKN